MKINMKSIVLTLLSVFLFAGATSLWAQEDGHGREVDEIVFEIKQNQEVDYIGDNRDKNWERGAWGSGMMGGWYGPGRMMGWVSPWVWIIGLVLLIALIVLVVFLARSHHIPEKKGGASAAGSEALEIIRTRYARGEISREEFYRLRDELQ